MSGRSWSASLRRCPPPHQQTLQIRTASGAGPPLRRRGCISWTSRPGRPRTAQTARTPVREPSVALVYSGMADATLACPGHFFVTWARPGSVSDYSVQLIGKVATLVYLCC